ncbi:MAG TPA: flagellar basal body P-ring formation chaperone FlgA [Alphaproteobacteria bacterium]|nr:flagellar basal body P-ring formation chaperone FlgA [Alphaproteobacteria bacterium]
MFSSTAAHAAVALKGMATIDGPAVRLSDVFSGVPQKIAAAEIARAPAPGQSITYNANTLVYLAHQYRLGWRPDSLADHVVINSSAHKIMPADIAREVRAQLAAQDSLDGDIRVSFDDHALEIDLPADRPAAFTLDNFQYNPADQRFRATFMASTDQGPVTRPITGRVAVMEKVPVPARRLNAGDVVAGDDLQWIVLPQGQLDGVITDASRLVGKELRHDANEGQPLREQDVMVPRLVKQGALVTMRIATSFMTVTAEGRALQDGTLGEAVRVRNDRSQRVIEGTVSGPGMVTVRGPQQFAEAQ